MVHELKTWPEFFTAMWEGRKPFEVRENDREYGVGNTLYLREFDPCKRCKATGREWDVGDKTDCGLCLGEKGKYTGREMTVEVTYLMKGGRFGVSENYVVMGAKIINRCPESGRYPPAEPS